jgi:HSP90 family molecular chaperone
VPSIHFTYTSNTLRIDCNELGFSPQNVEALCRVGQSTKKVASASTSNNNATRYVGEKGIGFKSVFKAADVIWIASGEYEFKFDKRRPLGMIAPIWDAFPCGEEPWVHIVVSSVVGIL